MRLAADNPMRTPLMITLMFEVIVFGLSIPVMIFISGLPGGLAGGLGGLAAGLALVSAGLMRTPAGYPLAWLTQLAGIALGIATPTMFVVGGLFAGIWLFMFVLGRRLERRTPPGSADPATE
ncbi:DUF4233 domain-containing protein [Microlunatus speluncae]|uniref:DUF4233 domain-containing protein n=1 Tax=Microlunatus speluncae TaxID=2594267 RepID=UPI001FEA09C4|nr:DUF4233 domain-containing protein [Microlunatus speluncae]